MLGFLLSLFCVRVTYSALKSVTPHPLCIASVSLLLGWVIYELSVSHDVYYPINVFSKSFQVHVPFYIGNMFHGLAFYSLGIWLRERQFCRWVLISAFCLFFIKFFFPAGMDFRTNDSGGSCYFLSLLYELCGCVIINNVFRKIANRKISLLSHIGQNSMVYYLVHYPLMSFAFLFINPFPHVSSSIRYILMSLILAALLVAFDYVFRVKRLRWMVGG